jgi:hypothetical protein
MKKVTLTPSQAAALAETAAALGAPVEWLRNVITFESRFNPAAVNPYSGAKGLIQFLDSTAEDMGFNSAADLVKKNPTIESQLRGPVLSYLAKYRPFPTEQSLYMSIFYPAARTWPMGQPFPAKVQAANPGIKTPGDYVAWVRKVSGAGIGAMGLLLLAAISFFLIRRS